MSRDSMEKEHESSCCVVAPKHHAHDFMLLQLSFSSEDTVSLDHRSFTGVSQYCSMASVHLIFLLLAFTCSFSSCHVEISWKELRTRNEVNQETVIELGHSVQSKRIDPSHVVQLSWRPRVFLYKGFLSDEECDHLISLAHGMKEEHLTNGGESGSLVMKRLLESSEVPPNIDDDITARIEERISAWTFLPTENGEPLQVEHYGREDAEQNFDYFGNKSSLKVSKPLMATVVLYLSNVSQGGEILFPNSEFKNSHSKSKIWSDCSKSSYALKPSKGNAILFFTLNLNASPDESSSHARCPVLAGEMWCATKFYHVGAINRQTVPLGSDGECTDEDENCPQWAALGECQKNPVFMIGSPDYYGTCRKSCNAC